MIKTIELSKIFSTDEVKTVALNRVTLEVKKGEFVAVMGPSGCGKTTLLNIVGLLDNPTSGSYYFLDREVTNHTEKQRANLRKRNIGFVFQNFNLIEELTVYENVELPLVYLNMNKAGRQERLKQILEETQISHKRNHFPSQLSGGQQQRVAVARAVVTKPVLILADEPTGNLDSANGEEVMNLLEKLNQSGTTIIIVTHSQRDAEFAQRIIHLYDGQIVNERFRINLGSLKPF